MKDILPSYFWRKIKEIQVLLSLSITVYGMASSPLIVDNILLTHWGRVTHICVSELTIIDSDNGLSPGRRQAIIWTNDGILLIGPLRTNFSEILFGIQTFSFNKMHLKMSSAKWHPFCLGLNVSKTCQYHHLDRLDVSRDYVIPASLLKLKHYLTLTFDYWG